MKSRENDTVPEELITFINEIKSAKGLSAYDEATTKQIIIQKILNILGWNIYDLKEIQPEYPVDKQNSNEKVDYALSKDTDYMVFIEAKAVNIDLENWEQQICNYCYKNNVILAVLTNGISWWFYLPRAKANWYERKFYSINIKEQETDLIVSRLIDFLSKENVLNGQAEDKAKKTHKSKTRDQILKKALPLAWNDLITSEDESLLDLFNNYIEKKSGYRVESQQVLAEFLGKNQAKLLLPEMEIIPLSKRTRTVEPLTPTEEEKTSAYVRKGFTSKRISAFIFNSKKYEVKSWKQLLLGICNEVNNLHQKEFDKVLSLKGRRRPYFTKNNHELRIPERIKGTDIYVEINLSANSIVSLCEDVLSLFGYKDSLKIESN